MSGVKPVLLYIDQYGQPVWARTGRELRERAGGGHVSKMYRDKLDGRNRACRLRRRPALVFRLSTRRKDCCDRQVERRCEMTAEPASFLDYWNAVGGAMLKLFGIDTSDAGMDADTIAGERDEGSTPNEFARW